MAASTPKQMTAEMAVERSHRLTSVTAHTVIAISVQMTVTEMETLIETFGRPDYDLTETQKAIHREFADAVYSLR